jgi:4-aminobutyrate aminotransferase-like enzyme
MRDHGVLATVCGGHTIRLLLPFRAGEPELREVWQAVSRAAEATT